MKDREVPPFPPDEEGERGAESLAEDPAPSPSSPEPEEPQGTSCVTPSGIEIEYQWAPRRLYKLREPKAQDWLAGYDKNPLVEVPSVTTVLGVLDKSGPLVWWAQKVALQGMITLHNEGRPVLVGDTVDDWVKLLTERELSVNHVKDQAADRGVNVHGALEKWAEAGWLPEPTAWPEDEQGYVTGVRSFLADIEGAEVVGTEIMVGSLQHRFAGRGDLWLSLPKPTEVVGKRFKREEIPAGKYLLDLKTRKKSNFYDTNYLQVEAYEAAAVECGYAPTDYRGVVVVLPDGRYQLRINQDWTFEDFLAVRACYQVMNERKIVQALRDELGAEEASDGA